MKSILSRLASVALIGTLAAVAVSAHASTTSSSKSKPAKSSKAVEKADDDPEPDVQGSLNEEYKCELGNSLTLYKNQDDPQHVAMRWKKRLYRLTRVDTTTGASRFENQKSGFIWIGIPAKGLLLDSKHGQQLANECKNTQQLVAEAEALAGAQQTK